MLETSTQLPRRIAEEIDAAAQRTGWTTSLTKAAERLPNLLRLTPAEFERLCGRVYNELATL